jgi:hypothetical protein
MQLLAELTLFIGLKVPTGQVWATIAPAGQ